MDNHIAVIQTELAPVLLQAKELSITKDEDLVQATTLLSEMNRVMDRVEEEKNKVLRPALDVIAAERARWKPIESAYKEAIEPLRDKMSVYETDAARKRLKDAEDAADKVSRGKMTLDEASNALDVTPRKIETPSGSLAFRDKHQVKIVNTAKIPKKYWKINEELILEALMNGETVAGAELEVIKVPVNRR